MMAGALGPVAVKVLTEGVGGLETFAVHLFQPVQPMLAESAADVEKALKERGEARLNASTFLHDAADAAGSGRYTTRH